MYSGSDGQWAVGINIFGGLGGRKTEWPRHGSGVVPVGSSSGRVLEKSGPFLPRFITNYSLQIIVKQAMFLKYSQTIILQ